MPSSIQTSTLFIIYKPIILLVSTINHHPLSESIWRPAASLHVYYDVIPPGEPTARQGLLCPWQGMGLPWLTCNVYFSHHRSTNSLIWSLFIFESENNRTRRQKVRQKTNTFASMQKMYVRFHFVRFSIEESVESIIQILIWFDLISHVNVYVS